MMSDMSCLWICGEQYNSIKEVKMPYKDWRTSFTTGLVFCEQNDLP